MYKKSILNDKYFKQYNNLFNKSIETEINENFDIANIEREKFIAQYNIESPIYNNFSPQNKEKIVLLIKKYISQLALYYHSEAQSKKELPCISSFLIWPPMPNEYFDASRCSDAVALRCIRKYLLS